MIKVHFFGKNYGKLYFIDGKYAIYNKPRYTGGEIIILNTRGSSVDDTQIYPYAQNIEYLEGLLSNMLHN